MDLGIRGKNALITAGSTGIGKGISVALAKEGVNLAVASRNPDEETLKELRNFGVNVIGIKADVSREKNVMRMVEEAIGKFKRIDFYINNAAWHWDEPVTKITTEGWENTVNTNLSGCIYACREAARHMIKNGNGSILITGSIAQFHPAYNETSYRISKTGLSIYTQNLAVELAPFGIRVNCIVPGFFQTKLTGYITKKFTDEGFKEALLRTIPLGRPGRPEEIGCMAAFLLSDKVSGFTTGASIVIDGGNSLSPVSFFTSEEIKKMNL